jgi:hypothetical protein
MLQKTEEATYQYWIIQTQLRARHITKTNKQTNLGKKRAIRTPPTTVEGDVKLHQ